MRRISTLRRALAVTGLAVGLLPAAAAHAGCTSVRLPVALSQGAAKTSVAAGQLWRPAHPGPRARTVQLLIRRDARQDLLGEPMSASEFTGLETGVYNPPATNPSIDVDVPVLLATGAHDSLFCGGQVTCTSTSQIVANETPYWPNAPRLDVAIVPFAGHDVNLHRTAPVFFLASQAWIAAHAG